MPRITTDLTQYLPVMYEARANIADGSQIRGTELARLIGTTWRILKQRILRDKAFPVIERGANGKPWTFDAAKAINHLIADLEKQMTKRAGRARRVRLQSGLDAADQTSVDTEDGGVDDPLDLAASARSVSLLAQAQMATHKLKQMQGEFVGTEAHVKVLATVMSTMQTETLAAAARIDPTGALPPDIRSQIETELKNVLLSVQDALDRALRPLVARKN
ncbi:hypothetical protein OOT33_13600 [Sphingobium sp. DEHP117]|uniref:hypothetical protein n=1 Tax=Sphingobium sp. DEHP117 TaxID=2993436 RepID=UPI0027D49ED2|nr:hypothetical protein [Sphingobium sp. DEHP117]MDQ4421457.1 hypothetical protein [Sphingobium sp. DEHP117]